MISVSSCVTRVFQKVLIVLLVLISGCSALSPYSTQTRLDIRLNADDRLNPDVNGRPSPVVFKLLELRRPVTFESMDFLSLYKRTGQVLGNDLVASEEFQLRPGDGIELKLKLDDSSRYVAVLAAYRNVSETRWRQVIQIFPNQQNRAVFVLGDSGLQLADRPTRTGKSL
ncbi:type VI secretion system lipoprotein TssJ [Pseudomonas syringae]|uniref:type VI secretion system lipoprotein TssJ n=1 Tax=Pseudomonas syringae TaxID=317 RepID=UPI000BB65B3E|nr:type VI secretion system lipoprotein TssJ [Pseudomonas syringae]PBP57775.1 type VI secretion system-associated lipoprotein [Pseudomonas syringae]PBQ04900.1 type VI secretion system-associated lipoprotein [Pseudomonas syringae]